MVLEVGAVLALIVFGTGAVVVCGPVEAASPILTGVGRAIIDIQLKVEKTFWYYSFEAVWCLFLS